MTLGRRVLRITLWGLGGLLVLGLAGVLWLRQSPYWAGFTRLIGSRISVFGFPRGYLMQTKQVQGFQTGDLVQADVPTGKKAGTYQGRVAVRATGSFNIQTRQGVVQGISHRYCRLLQRADGYGYTLQPKPREEDASRAA
ncbi:hypothetical protein [Halorhodospira abdelmalekii]|uniref:hypothetical protein n=1 Tax=Halorhodospira abdelmalekii TaxID=421629 RepID=UPI001F5B78CC|nr:hypothetical protein [Halorhodospira abdelmalekii]